MRATHGLPALRAGHHRHVIRGDLHGLSGQITDPGAVMARENQLADIPAGRAGVGCGDVHDAVLLLGSRRTRVCEHPLTCAATSSLRVGLSAAPAVRRGVLALLSLQLLDTLLELFDLLGLPADDLVEILFRQRRSHADHPLR
ncbi:hypothetical protein LAJ19_00270 [Deinococcus taeanensis]|uniref:hypothetical protein n=1 Tax=Deinococcus taeanensis TaxID=2737050 RepID=UPI001CDD3772|nr:hypothetical protein [Deinococcus taeanensis]UBV42714.1 hypothetical protein LAJ19_00270 [Deinococcus taeanensis]